MPPPAAKTYRDLILYDWAKAIARSAGMNGGFAFIMDRMSKLREGDLRMSEIVREDRLMAVDGRKACAYCGSGEELTWDHLVPTSRGGPDTISNYVPACSTCNSSKGDRDAIEWYRSRKGAAIPRLVWGKYLKLTYETWKASGQLDKHLTSEEKARWSGLTVE